MHSFIYLLKAYWNIYSLVLNVIKKSKFYFDFYKYMIWKLMQFAGVSGQKMTKNLSDHCANNITLIYYN